MKLAGRIGENSVLMFDCPVGVVGNLFMTADRYVITIDANGKVLLIRQTGGGPESIPKTQLLDRPDGLASKSIATSRLHGIASCPADLPRVVPRLAAVPVQHLVRVDGLPRVGAIEMHRVPSAALTALQQHVRLKTRRFIVHAPSVDGGHDSRGHTRAPFQVAVRIWKQGTGYCGGLNSAL